ncbi:class I SAM-dependent methyltransferase [Mesobacillus thioparans]|uniref:class I SAM-dependent methyltransferase n=1 Tax=Mesobacillus thioparans TaxID=370439 RepID=UPI0039F084E6
MEVVKEQWLRLHEDVSNKMIEISNIQNYTKALDLCTGTGFIPKMLRINYDNIHSVVGIDNDPTLIKSLKNTSEDDITWICSDVEKYSFPKTDIIFCSFGFMYINKTKKLLQAIENSLSADGEMIISLWDNFGPEHLYIKIKNILYDYLGLDKQSINESPINNYRVLLKQFFPNIIEIPLTYTIEHKNYKEFINFLIERELHFLPIAQKEQLYQAVLEFNLTNDSFIEEANVRILIAKKR